MPLPALARPSRLTGLVVLVPVLAGAASGGAVAVPVPAAAHPTRAAPHRSVAAPRHRTHRTARLVALGPGRVGRLLVQRVLGAAHAGTAAAPSGPPAAGAALTGPLASALAPVVAALPGTSPADTAAPVPATTPAPPSLPTPPPATLGVQASETPAYRMLLSRTSVAAGEVRVQLRDTGEDPHNLVIGRADGTGDAVAVPLTQPGASTTQTVRLRAGTYRLYCSLTAPVVHETAGMRATLTVTG